jgi:hypothetical protein
MMAAFSSWLRSRLAGLRLGTIGTSPAGGLARRCRWRRMVALVGERPGRGWRPGRRDELAAPEGRSPASGSCGPARRPGPRRLGDGSAPAPRRARVLEPGQHQAGRRLGDSKARPSVLGRVGGPGVVAGRLPAAPGSGCAMPRAGRGWGLAAGWRLGSARRPGTGGSSRPIPRTAEPPQRSSGSAVTTGPARSREAVRAAPARGSHHPSCDPELAPWCA